MFTVVFGIIIGVAILVQALSGVSQNSKLYLDVFSFILVAGGTISAAFMSVTWKNLHELFSCLKETFFQSGSDENEVVQELIEISEKASSVRKISVLDHKSQNTFIQKGVRLLQNEIEADNIKRILYEDLQSYKSRMSKNSDLVRSIAKFPPAFGMIGTILGLIGLLEDMSLSTGMETIGVKMAMALVTTLYGLLIANYILVPISEILVNKSQLELTHKKKIVDTFVMIAINRNDPVLIREFLGRLSHRDDEALVAEAA